MSSSRRAASVSLDAAVLVVALASVMWAFRGGSGVNLRPSWLHALVESDDALVARASWLHALARSDGALIENELATSAAPLPPPAVVADVDGDGTPEIVVATADGHVHLLLAPGAARGGATAAPGAAQWRSLTVKRSASLRGRSEVLTGRRPTALAAGAVSAQPGADGRLRQIVVVLTEDWSVLAFDDQLQVHDAVIRLEPAQQLSPHLCFSLTPLSRLQSLRINSRCGKRRCERARSLTRLSRARESSPSSSLPRRSRRTI